MFSVILYHRWSLKSKKHLHMFVYQHIIYTICTIVQCFPCSSAGKESTCNARDLVSIPGLGRSSGEGNSYPLQYSGLENSRDYTVNYQFSSDDQSCLTLCDYMDCSSKTSLSITNSQSLHKLMSIESVMPSNYLILCHSLFLPPSIFPRIRVFSNESVLCIWPKYWNFFSFGLCKGQSTGLSALDFAKAKVLDFQLQHQSFQCICRTDFLQVRLVGSSCCPGDSKESSPAPQFKSINSLALIFFIV